MSATDETLREVVASLLETDALTPNHDGTPEHYTVHADDVNYLVETVRALLAEHPATPTEPHVWCGCDPLGPGHTCEEPAEVAVEDLLCLCHETICPVHNEAADESAEYRVADLLARLRDHDAELTAKAKVEGRAEGLREASDERAAKKIAADAADRFRDVLSECLGHGDENPGDDVLVAEAREHFGKSGPEPTRWRDFLTGAIAQVDQIRADREIRGTKTRGDA